METLQPVLKSGAMYADWEAFPPAILRGRIAAVQAAVAAAGDDAWLVYGDAQRSGELVYLAHYPARQRGSFLIVPRAGDPVLLAAVGSRDIPASKLLTWVADVRPFSRIVEALPALLDELGLATGKLGVVGVRDAFAIGDWEGVRRALPAARWTDRDAPFRVLRHAPDPLTAAGVRRAATALDAALDGAEAAFVAGTSVRAAAGAIERRLRLAAAEDVRLLVGRARAGGALEPPGDVLLEAGETVLLFAGVQIQRCWAEAGRTLTLGAAPAAGVALAALATRAVDAMAATARGGGNAGAAAEAAAVAIADPALLAGATDYGLGHAIGLDVDEPPAIEAGSAATFAGSTGLALHVVLVRDGAGALAARTLDLTEDTR